MAADMFSNFPCVSIPILLQLSTNSQVLILSITIQTMYKHYERYFLPHKQHRFMHNVYIIMKDRSCKTMKKSGSMMLVDGRNK